jgi:hypothetical protein
MRGVWPPARDSVPALLDASADDGPMLIEWVDCDVSLDQLGAFFLAQEKGSCIAEFSEFLIQAGGWDLKRGV